MDRINMDQKNSTVDLSMPGAGLYIELITDAILSYTAVVLKMVLNPILGVVSVCANLTNMAVFSKMGLSNGVNQNFFILSLSDSLIAVTALVNSAAYVCQVILKVYGKTLGGSNTDAQIVYWAAFFAFPFGQNFSLITTVVIALVRCCCVAMPLRVKDVLTARRQLAAILLFSAISSSVYLYAFYPLRVEYGRDPEDNSTVAFMVDAVWVVYIGFNNATFFGGFIVVAVCATILSLSLYRSVRFRKSFSSGKTRTGSGLSPPHADAQTRARQRDARVVKTVVMVSFSFIVCNLVTIIYLVLFLALSGFGPLGRFANANQFTLMITETFALVNATVNIFIYASYTTRYRATLSPMLGRNRTRIGG